MKYVVVFHKTEDNMFSAFVPDVPNCMVVGDSAEEVRAGIHDALYISTHCNGKPPDATAFIEEIDADDASDEVRKLLD